MNTKMSKAYSPRRARSPRSKIPSVPICLTSPRRIPKRDENEIEVLISLTSPRPTGTHHRDYQNMDEALKKYEHEVERWLDENPHNPVFEKKLMDQLKMWSSQTRQYKRERQPVQKLLQNISKAITVLENGR